MAEWTRWRRREGSLGDEASELSPELGGLVGVPEAGRGAAHSQLLQEAAVAPARLAVASGSPGVVVYLHLKVKNFAFGEAL